MWKYLSSQCMQVCSLMTFGVINAEHVGGTNDLLWSVWTQLQASTELHSSTSRRKWENNTENVCVGVHVCVNNVTLMGLRCQQDVTPCPLQREHVCMYKLFGVQTQSIPIQNKYIKIELLLLHSNFITWHTPRDPFKTILGEFLLSLSDDLCRPLT